MGKIRTNTMIRRGKVGGRWCRMVWLLGSDEKIHSLVLDERFRQAGFSSVTTSEVVAFRDFLATDPSILLELEEEIGRTVDGGGTGDRKERVLPSFDTVSFWVLEKMFSSLNSAKIRLFN